MGLDNFWVQTAQAAIVLDPPLDLCGGIMSAHGSTSFRGKVYERYIMNISGVSLYQDLMGRDDVAEIADALHEDHEMEIAKRFNLEDDYEDLVRMFVFAKDNGLQLKGWW